MAWVVACQANDLTINDLSSAVVTVVDSGTSLRDARSFALPDTIVELPAGAATLAHGTDRLITASVRRHLVALGWRDVSDDSTARPDVVVLAASATRIQTGVAYGDWFRAWSYLGCWQPDVDATWRWTVPQGAIPYAYQAGTLIVAMLDLRATNDTSRSIPVLWAAALDGLAVGPAVTPTKTMQGVDQAFAQSAYLRVEP